MDAFPGFYFSITHTTTGFHIQLTCYILLNEGNVVFGENTNMYVFKSGCLLDINEVDISIDTCLCLDSGSEKRHIACYMFLNEDIARLSSTYPTKVTFQGFCEITEPYSELSFVEKTDVDAMYIMHGPSVLPEHSITYGDPTEVFRMFDSSGRTIVTPEKGDELSTGIKVYGGYVASATYGKVPVGTSIVHEIDQSIECDTVVYGPRFETEKPTGLIHVQLFYIAKALYSENGIPYPANSGKKLVRLIAVGDEIDYRGFTIRNKLQSNNLPKFPRKVTFRGYASNATLMIDVTTPNSHKEGIMTLRFRKRKLVDCF